MASRLEAWILESNIAFPPSSRFEELTIKPVLSSLGALNSSGALNAKKYLLDIKNITYFCLNEAKD